jgi:NAD(P)H-dependent flavin oxidoreductase YrpB (nitropropane dioxygenase family)
VLRTIGIIGVDQVITAAEMRAYDNIFVAASTRAGGHRRAG